MLNKKSHWLILFLILSLCGCASTAMETAVNRGDCEGLKKLIAQKEDVNAVSSCNTTMLFWSVLKVNWDCVQILLDNGADPNIPDCLNTTPMLWVARIGNINIVKSFIDKGANLNVPNDDKNTPLLYATYNPDIEVIKLLVAHGADIKAVNKDGDNALLFIANNVAENINTMDRQHFDAYKDIWDYLVEKGVDPYQMNKYGKSASSYIDLYPVYCQKFGEYSPAQQSAVKTHIYSDPDVAANIKNLEDSRNVEGLEQYLDKHPDAIALIKGDALRLSMYGPSKLRVLDVQQYLKNGLGQKVVIAQINASKSPYKIFTPDEASFLQSQGIPEEVIAAMITRTTAIEEEQEKDAKAQQTLIQQQQLQQQYAQQNQQNQQEQPQQQTVGQTAVQEATNQAVQQGVKMLFDHFNPFK